MQKITQLGGGFFPLGYFCLGDRKNNWGDFEKNGIYPFLYNLSLDNVFTALLVSVLKTFGSNRLYLLLTLFFYTTVYRCWLRKKKQVFGMSMVKIKKRRNRKFPSLYLFNIENNAKTQKNGGKPPSNINNPDIPVRDRNYPRNSRP